MNELNLYQLFKDIIAKSKVMKRFVVAPQYGVELNKNNIGEILKDILGGISDGVKYPVCIMFPPVEIVHNILGDNNWSCFNCKLFFLAAQYNDSNGTQDINFDTNLSEHTIPMTWTDMRQCALDFRRIIEMITERNLEKGIRGTEDSDVLERYSDIGNDRSAGIGISFSVDVFTGCEISDYSEEDINDIEINTNNLHALHEY